MSILRTIQAALVAALLTAGALTVSTPAPAATVHFDSGVVAFGYSDGYWDRSKQWHRWPSRTARNEWRERYHEHYYSRAHTHANGWGWRDERWWERH